MLNSLQIKQYQKTILTEILSSQFVYSTVNQKCELKKQELIIERKKRKRIYYLYLFLTTNKRPYVKRKYVVSKNLKKKQSTSKLRLKSLIWKVEINKKHFSAILSYILFQIIPFQTNSEQKILKLNARNLDLLMEYAPLTTRTAGLKLKNNYLSDIPLVWRLQWTKNSSIFQKIFILKHLKILNETIPFKHLENEIE